MNATDSAQEPPTSPLRFAASAEDYHAAADAYREGRRMSVAEWLAYVWHATGLPTAPVLYQANRDTSGFRGWRISTTPAPECRPNYMSPTTICRQGSVWMEATGGNVVQWARELLEDVCIIGDCVNAANGREHGTAQSGIARMRAAYNAATLKRHDGQAPDPSWLRSVAGEPDPYADEPQETAAA